MKAVLFILIFISTVFANSQNQSRMNTIKSLIQKEEYIALAVNKYILQTRTLPIVNPINNRSLDWTALSVDNYLGSNFNRVNPFTGENINASFDSANNLYIKGAIESYTQYTALDHYLYNFYANQTFRVNTISVKSISQADLLKGTQVIYNGVAREVVTKLTDGDYVRLNNENCPNNDYFYELENGKLTYKFCRGDYSVAVYQRPPIILENLDDLKYIKGKIGDKAFAERNGNWYEYYYQGDLAVSWVPVESGSILHSQDEEEDIEDRIISYIPNSKDLSIRDKGGCMLANGDIFCWGDNTNKKAGIESKGQLNPNFSPDYINTPVMLKVQIDNTTAISGITRRDKKWFNNPYRVKFEKMAVNSTNVCGISPIFDYFQAGTYKKFGGDLYCNGRLNSKYFEDIDDTNNITITTSILKRNKFFALEKDDEIDDSDKDEIYLKDIAMIDGTIAVLSESGKIFTAGSNDKGSLGINNSDTSIVISTPNEVNLPNQIFKSIYALRNTKTFAALDEYGKLWLWGERPNGNIFIKPTLEDASRGFDSTRVFINSEELILRGLDKKYYKTSDTSTSITTEDISSSVPGTALSASILRVGNENRYLYIDSQRKLQGTTSLQTCRWKTGSLCGQSANRNLFDLALSKLNGPTDEDGNFSNVTIFSSSRTGTTISEDFENGTSGWNNNSIHNGGLATKFLGRFNGFGLGEQIYKTYNFGASNALKDVEISFDFLEIDNWDGPNAESGDAYIDEVTIYVNGRGVSKKVYTSLEEDAIPGEKINISGTNATVDEKHTILISDKTDSSGNLKLSIGALLNSNLSNESWGIDNIRITIKEDRLSDSALNHFVCAMTGLGSASQMYCWGMPDRSLPILSTSLYDVSKIDNLNKLFITTSNEVLNSMAYNEFNNSGKLYLKYPVYIGGFDYEFYFK